MEFKRKCKSGSMHATCVRACLKPDDRPLTGRALPRARAAKNVRRDFLKQDQHRFLPTRPLPFTTTFAPRATNIAQSPHALVRHQQTDIPISPPYCNPGERANAITRNIPEGFRLRIPALKARQTTPHSHTANRQQT
jgi:hypothetical protein